MALAQGYIGTTETTLFTAAQTAAIVSIVLCNTSSSTPISVIFRAIPSGDSTTAESNILDTIVLAPKESISPNIGKLILGAGDVLSGIAVGGTNVTATISYVNI